MKEGIGNRLWQLFVYLMIALIIGGGIVLIYPTYCQGQALRKKESDLQAQIEAVKAEISRIQEYQRRFKSDPDFVESIARRNRRVYPGELVFLFED